MNTSCDDIPGTWSNWSNFSDCSVTCGGGTRVKTRTCLTGICRGDDNFKICKKKKCQKANSKGACGPNLVNAPKIVEVSYKWVWGHVYVFLLVGGLKSRYRECEGGLLCGGKEEQSIFSNICYQRTENKWEKLKFFITSRNGHTAWNSSRGLVLIGGDHTATATVLITGHSERKYFSPQT